MNRVEISLVVTLFLAIVSGVFFIGTLHGRVVAIENDKNYESFRIAKEKALNEILEEKGLAYNLIQSEKEEALGKMSSLKQFNQTDCRVIDSAVNGGRLMCNTGEYVAGAQNLKGKNNVLDFIICCKP
ncbi:hypothetical protein QSV34_02505 [Porticoccus sp. W117]|uniref:hypothetical protein n=1 Tax=Porticoccus sp. W117 TaxID=3054777 RepID=UPI0025935096|nr:hypothetical protein [Porticoccus sp. W117]MDM3870222.1 hypothetical protein [Porticoccus sp. W117]